MASENDVDLRDIFRSTFAILFFGTPHRGSEWADAGQIIRKFTSASGLSISKYNLQALQENTEILELLREDFARRLGENAFHVTSFQESYGLRGIEGLDAKASSSTSTERVNNHADYVVQIVEPDSSGLDHHLERKIPINDTHLDLCKFPLQGSKRREYDEKVRPEIFRHWQRELKKIQEQAS